MNKYILLLLLCLPIAGQAGNRLYGPFQADVVRVIDGDTLKVHVYIWPGLSQLINFRLDGINSPEKRSHTYKVNECEKGLALKATEFTRSFISDKALTVSNIRLGKYSGRVLGALSANGEDLSQALLEAGLAKKYHGGKRLPWPECQI